MKQITVFISEDVDISQIICDKYFGAGVTFAIILPADKREEIVKSLEKYEPK